MNLVCNGAVIAGLMERDAVERAKGSSRVSVTEEMTLPDGGVDGVDVGFDDVEALMAWV